MTQSFHAPNASRPLDRSVDAPIQILVNLPCAFPPPRFQFGQKVISKTQYRPRGRIVGMSYNTPYICISNGRMQPGWEYMVELEPFQMAIDEDGDECCPSELDLWVDEPLLEALLDVNS